MRPVRQILNSDLTSDFDAIYDRYHRLVRSVLFRFVPDSSLDDLVQEAFVRVWKKHSELRNAASEKNWVCKIALNVAYDALRRRGRNLETQSELVNAPAPESDAEASELARRALEQLSLVHREVITLVCFEGFSLAETAEITNVELGTVKSRLHYAREKMAAFLRAAGVNL